MPDRQLLRIFLGRSRCGRGPDLDPVCNLIWERQQLIALWKVMHNRTSLLRRTTGMTSFAIWMTRSRRLRLSRYRA